MRASLTAVLSPISDTTAARLRPHGLNEFVAISPGGSRAPETCSASRHTTKQNSFTGEPQRRNEEDGAVSTSSMSCHLAERLVEHGAIRVPPVTQVTSRSLTAAPC